MAAQPEKMHFPAGEAQQQWQWIPDERDGFISWLRSEFAAANAIIDVLVQHLRVVGEPGEYEHVIGSIHQRRLSWAPVIYMQHYFSISDVLMGLQHAAMRKQQRHFEKEGRKTGSFGYRHRQEIVRENHGSSSNLVSMASEVIDSVKEKDKSEKEEDDKLVGEGQAPGLDSSVTSVVQNDLEEIGNNLIVNHGGGTTIKQEEKNELVPIPKVLVGNEMIEGRMVNVVEGLKLYEEIFDVTEMTKLISLSNDMRIVGQRGDFPGKSHKMHFYPIICSGPNKIVAMAQPREDGECGCTKILDREAREDDDVAKVQNG
ncbi:hypothetical protein HPP92_016403 [Vanilla planifolia]|uniref:Uncharacterized protein n=1 Tax=Vanilla planifolia TaxID=51239 RepID=A0A835UQ27_VANPL|nr:hypothetical protein HPP92_016403 [Vanilla planifolia]